MCRTAVTQFICDQVNICVWKQGAEYPCDYRGQTASSPQGAETNRPSPDHYTGVNWTELVLELLGMAVMLAFQVFSVCFGRKWRKRRRMVQNKELHEQRHERGDHLPPPPQEWLPVIPRFNPLNPFHAHNE